MYEDTPSKYANSPVTDPNRQSSTSPREGEGDVDDVITAVEVEEEEEEEEMKFPPLGVGPLAPPPLHPPSTEK